MTTERNKALVGAFSVITNLRMELFQALVGTWVGVLRSLGAALHVSRASWAEHDTYGELCHFMPNITGHLHMRSQSSDL